MDRKPTAGSMIGMATGLAVALVVSVDMIHLILGPCFFEGGCQNEGLGLVAVGIACLVVGAAAGLLAREVANRLLTARR